MDKWELSAVQAMKTNEAVNKGEHRTFPFSAFDGLMTCACVRRAGVPRSQGVREARWRLAGVRTIRLHQPLIGTSLLAALC